MLFSCFMLYVAYFGRESCSKSGHMTPKEQRFGSALLRHAGCRYVNSEQIL